MSDIQAVNLGCGDRYLPGWVNIDFISHDPAVIAHNLRQGIPLPDATCDLVYHSHVLEHFSAPDGQKLIQECYRVLKPGGILRVVVPDLEGIAREYLKQLEQVRSGDRSAKPRHQWMVLEMIDQAARNQSGGDMWSFLVSSDEPTYNFIKTRFGGTIPESKQKLKEQHDETMKKYLASRPGFLSQVRGKIMTFLGMNHEQQQTGKFRLSGESHLTMYDDVLLSDLLTHCGFANPQRVNATSSSIPNWENYLWLDVESNSIRKPDSLFIEAMKPS